MASIALLIANSERLHNRSSESEHFATKKSDHEQIGV